MSSLPVPLSPVIRTVASVGATLFTLSITWWSAPDDPKISPETDDGTTSSGKVSTSLSGLSLGLLWERGRRQYTSWTAIVIRLARVFIDLSSLYLWFCRNTRRYDVRGDRWRAVPRRSRWERHDTP
ncbi:MAG: hypothetical protein WDO73_29675 [Ignavibacteriota bacterium]